MIGIPDSAIVATHVYATGPAHALTDYLVHRARRVTFVGHPFSYARDVRSHVREFEDHRLAAEHWARWHRRLPEPLTWARDVVLTLWWVARRPRFELFLGADPMLAATGLVLRALGRVDRVVLWTIDYSPQRFSSRFLNAMYHRIDRLCVRRCDDVWVLSPAMAAARAQRGIARRQRVVPMGSRRIARTGATAGAEIVFVGHLLAKQGVQIVLRALPIVRRSVSDARFTIVGDGPYRSELERLVRELNIVDAVEFTGFLDDHADVERVLAQAAVGVATYDPECASFTAFADPGKVKAYVAAALPVVTTRTHPLAEELEARGCGIVVPYGPEPVAAALALLLSDDELRVRYARNAGTFAREFEWEAVFDRAFA